VADRAWDRGDLVNAEFLRIGITLSALLALVAMLFRAVHGMLA